MTFKPEDGKKLTGLLVAVWIAFIGISILMLVAIGGAIVALAWSVWMNPTPRAVICLVGICVGTFCCAYWAVGAAGVARIDDGTKKWLSGILIGAILTSFATGISMAFTGSGTQEPPGVEQEGSAGESPANG